MWIDNSINQPQKEGNYKTLIEIDEMGTLSENDNEHFNGKDWSHTESSRQFIRYWWCEKEEYKVLSDKYEEGLNKYLEESKPKEENKLKAFIEKYFNKDEYPIIEQSIDYKWVIISIADPEIQKVIESEEFQANFTQSGYTRYEINYGYRIEPDFETKENVQKKVRDYNDKIIFEVKEP